MDLQKHLKIYFGHDNFRPNQEVIVKTVVEGMRKPSKKRDVMAIMPTGSGKSLCYCLPALICDTICIVVSPLIALMQDQVQRLLKRGVKATYLGSHQTYDVEERVFAGDYSIVFVTPEKLLHRYDAFVRLHNSCGIGLIAVDECHCIDRWGHDFRPKYNQLSQLRTGQVNARRAELAGIPIAAFTATATTTTQREIIRNLRLRKPLIVRSNFDRPNLYYSVEQQTKGQQEIIACLQQQGIGATQRNGGAEENSTAAGGCAIIYSTTRDGCPEMAAWLRTHGYTAAIYHAGMTPKARDTELRRFLAGEVDCIVATEAFGMGIDKANIRAVIHNGMPKSIEAYYQQSGRAGRDGKPAVCCLFYSRQEFVLKQNHLRNIASDRRKSVEQKLWAMFNYVDSRVKCRRRHLLQYFDCESTVAHDRCCDLCGTDETIDIEQYRFLKGEIQLLHSVVATIRRKKKYGFGISTIRDVVCGSESKAVERHRLDRLDCFNAATTCPQRHPKVWWRRAIDLAIRVRCLETDRHGALVALDTFDFEAAVLPKTSQTVALIDSLRPKTKKTQRSNRTATGRSRNTLDLTWEMCKERLSLDAIADKRGLKRATIAEHIKKLIESGKPVHVETYCPEPVRRAMESVAKGFEYAKDVRLAKIRAKLYETLNSNQRIDYDVVKIAYIEQVMRQSSNA